MTQDEPIFGEATHPLSGPLRRILPANACETQLDDEVGPGPPSAPIPVVIKKELIDDNQAAGPTAAVAAVTVKTEQGQAANGEATESQDSTPVTRRRDEFLIQFGKLASDAKKLVEEFTTLNTVLTQAASEETNDWSWAKTFTTQLQGAANSTQPTVTFVQSSVLLVRPLKFKQTYGDDALQRVLDCSKEVVKAMTSIESAVGPLLRMQAGKDSFTSGKQPTKSRKT